MPLDYEYYDPRMLDLILPNSELMRVHTGMLWAEGPVYFPAGDYFLWSDIPNNRLYQWPTDSSVRVFSYDSGYTNGNTRDGMGRLVSCRHLSRSVTRTEPDGTTTTLAALHDNRKLNSPNDVVTLRDGSIWFTDPTYGILTDYEGKKADPEQDFCGVYCIAQDKAEPQAVVTELEKPNGLAFSKDESVLYVADSARSHNPNGHHHVFACPVDGHQLGKPAALFEIEHGVPDGMRIDEHNHIWCSSARGVEIFDGQGVHIGCINIPEPVANLEFGGRKGNRLLITASQSVYCLYVAVKGVRAMEKD
ncbi:MAG: SMP-30/gluconolactonase/LRE family protein [Paracoccaceae bacterium]